MNIYSLEENNEQENYYDVSDTAYVTHEKKFSQEEFKEICQECLDKCYEKCLHKLIIELSKLGFKVVESIADFEFDYEEPNYVDEE